MNYEVPKSEWGDGPWQSEPDKAEWTYAGLHCLIQRVYTGAWGGYVALPPTHPLFGVGRNDMSLALVDQLETRLQRPMLETEGLDVMMSLIVGDGLSPTPVHVLEVHGGLTWSKKYAPLSKPDGRWWFGFDCAHGRDVQPAMNALLRRFGFDFEAGLREIAHGTHFIYRDEAYVRAETESLAQQLAALHHHEPISPRTTRSSDS